MSKIQGTVHLLYLISVFCFIALFSTLFFYYPGLVQDQITEDLFPGDEEEESSADDLTPSVTSNTSELLRRLRGIAQTKTFTHDYMTFK